MALPLYVPLQQRGGCRSAGAGGGFSFLVSAWLLRALQLTIYGRHGLGGMEEKSRPFLLGAFYACVLQAPSRKLATTVKQGC